MTTHEQTDTRDPADIEREIRQTQEEMSRTVDQIEGQFTPRNLINALLEKADEKGIDARYAVDTARRNPLALAMISLGGIWLVSDSDAKVSSLKPSGLGQSAKNKDMSGWDAHHRGYVDHMSRCEPQENEDAAAFRRRRDLSRANYLMIEQGHDEDESSFRQRLDHATESLRERRDSMMDQTREWGRGAAGSARNVANQTEELYQSNPLAGGVIAGLIGALAGALAPVTRTEEQQIGKLGARALDLADEKSHELGGLARDKKDELVEKADHSLEAKGHGGGEQKAAGSQQASPPAQPVF